MGRLVKIKCSLCSGRGYTIAPDDYAAKCSNCKGAGHIYKKTNGIGMTKRDLIKALEQFDDGMVVVINDGKYWSHIEKITADNIAIEIKMEEYPAHTLTKG